MVDSVMDHLTCRYLVGRRLDKGSNYFCNNQGLFQVDIHIMKEPPNGEWTLLSTQLTDRSGRITYKVQGTKEYQEVKTNSTKNYL